MAIVLVEYADKISCHLDKQLGPVDVSAAKAIDATTTAGPKENQQPKAKKEKIPISLCLCLDDIEAAAAIAIPKPAWTYFHSASDGLGSLRNNQQDWKKVTFRPRVMRDVKRVDLRRVMLGHASSLPFFIAPAARATLVHPDGELCLVRGAARAGIPYCPSTFASFPHAELAECLKFENSQDGQGCMFFQLYVAKYKKRTIELLTMARKLGFKALLITVDTAVVGKREEDERYRAEQDYLAGRSNGALVDWQRRSESPGDAPVLRGHCSSTLSWDDLPWIREAWGAETGPVVLKGIQTVEDAVMAVQAGVDAIYLSNHGGRQCDDAPSSLRVLLEIHRFHPEILGKVEIYLDGWVRRGADILKAIALGATGVAIGRPFMYSLQYGTGGVLKAIQSESYLFSSSKSIY